MVLFLGVTLASGLVVSGVLWLWLRRANREAGERRAASRLINLGRYSQALNVFGAESELRPSDPIAAFNAGVCRLHLWQLPRAAADFERARALGHSAALAAILPEHLSLTYALLGRAPEAARLLEGAPAGGHPGRQALVRAILHARSGDPIRARAQLGTFEAKQLGGVMGGLARTVDAYCVEALTGEQRHVDRVALFGETGADGLAQAWPELIDFVERAPAT